VEAFSQVAARALTRAGMSQAAVAKRLRIAPATVAQWIAGVRPVPVNRIESLADAVGVDGDERERLILAALLVTAPPALANRIDRLMNACGDHAWDVLAGRAISGGKVPLKASTLRPARRARGA
jgi:transcriptional regulator with XRE-family HTH domain